MVEDKWRRRLQAAHLIGCGIQRGSSVEGDDSAGKSDQPIVKQCESGVTFTSAAAVEVRQGRRSVGRPPRADAPWPEDGRSRFCVRR